MATASRHEGDHYFAGNVAAQTMSIPDGTVTKEDVQANAGIEASKLQHQHQPTFSQPNTAATSETRAVHVVYGATGTILGFKAGSIAAAIGAATVTVDLKKNGVSVLTGVITLNNANTARVAVAGTLAGAGAPALVAGDVLEVVTVATAGGGTLPTGVFAQPILTEAAQ